MSRERYKKFVGIGLYTVPEAARLTGAPNAKIMRWLGETKCQAGVVRRDSALDHTVSFMELMELMFIAMFRKEGVSLQTIRRAADAAARQFGTKHPFAARRFDTDGRDIFITLSKAECDQQLVQDLARGQLVFEQIIRPFFRKLEYSSAEAIRYWPLEPSGRVVLDPSRRFGQPIDSETGVPTDAIIAALSAGGGQDVTEVADWLDIPVEAVQAAITFDRSLAS
ncbi:MAG: DUF433 domain-containing protein [Planctomycetaceae bacterium]